jgi:hypothetical protein
MLFALTVSLFGSAFGFRMFHRMIARQYFEKAEMTKIGTLYLLGVVALALVLPRSHLSLWVAVFSPLAVLSIILFSLVKQRSAKFRRALVDVLTIVSLKMKTGRSFRRALSEVTAESEPRIRAKLSEIGSVVVFSQQNTVFSSDPFISSFVSELILIDRQPHAATRRLAVFREKIRIEDDFRRKSGQVLARIRAQSYVMTGLYVALAAFMAWKFGWRTNIRLYFISASLFVIGLVWMWRGGRNLKWKV